MKKLIIVILLVTSILVGCTTNELINKTDTEELVFQPYLEIQKNSSISLGIHNVPEGYMVPAKQQGKVVRFDYMTNTYDYQDRVMKKYAYVYIPYGYETSTERYDVVYTMHGHTGDVTSFPGELDDLTDIKNVIDHLIEKKEMKPMLMVFASYYHDNVDMDTDDYDASLTEAFGKELQNDLIPQFENAYRTYASSTSEEDLIVSRDHRIFLGFSMGAVTTWYRMMDSMRYFRYYVPFSGSLYWGNRTTVAQYGRDNPSCTAQLLENAIIAQGYTADDFYVLTLTGTKDFAYRTVKMQIDDMKQHPDMFHYDSDEVEGNFTLLLAANEEHDYYAKRLYIFNSLPILSQMIAKRDALSSLIHD